MRLFALLLAAALLCGCNEPTLTRYVDKRYLFSFVPPRGWRVTAEQTPSCLTSVSAGNGACGFYVCVSERPEDFLPTTSDFANCELVKDYVAEKLKGYGVQCKPSLLQGRRTYDAIYLRNVADAAGAVRFQLVRQTFLARGRLLYTITSYVFGHSEAELKAATSPCDDDILRSEGTFFLHQPPTRND
ncbi:hypothetical protein DFW101_0158 [Solidesulfovibrio carbinoliphilus subsp. oakridgensis]|uniref:Lipoprotein n=1 Tax=Solidesulfovibrio carbinoliphilus subsp. oakridgensis TaxID=694327 RepID=G7QCL9_9BACT|nr:hypothetical protein [Solidesulfovibrio carbinoliphilus]EHJ46175.1 hypothetical protein DFW101_0158 [Solidesulfovibrio carbinoliphilus subsp. oakridgensis]